MRVVNKAEERRNVGLKVNGLCGRQSTTVCYVSLNKADLGIWTTSVFVRNNPLGQEYTASNGGNMAVGRKPVIGDLTQIRHQLHRINRYRQTEAYLAFGSLFWLLKVKVKLSLCFNWSPRHDGVLGECKYSSTHSVTSAIDGGEWSASRPRPGRFTSRERAPGTNWIGV